MKYSKTVFNFNPFRLMPKSSFISSVPGRPKPAIKSERDRTNKAIVIYMLKLCAIGVDIFLWNAYGNLLKHICKFGQQLGLIQCQTSYSVSLRYHGTLKSIKVCKIVVPSNLLTMFWNTFLGFLRGFFFTLGISRLVLFGAFGRSGVSSSVSGSLVTSPAAITWP